MSTGRAADGSGDGVLPRGLRLASIVPAFVLLAGLGGRMWLQPSGPKPLERPLTDLPAQFEGYQVADTLEIPPAALQVLDPDSYLVRRYRSSTEANGEQFELFVAYYGQQLGGSTIHSPRNCLPGSGWEPVEHRTVRISTVRGEAPINRYLIQNDDGDRALVYYWYQGRGRIEASEYTVKWDLVRDAVLERRSDEALVRLVFRLEDEGEGAGDQAATPDRRSVASAVASEMWKHLPDG